MNDEPEELLEPTPDPDAPGECLVVGLGASAGGIQALQAFFEHVPSDSGMAYVVILHLSPDHDSHLAQVLQSTCSVPVTRVTEAVRVEPNHVYVVAPDEHVTINDGQKIQVSRNTTVEDRRAPVDIFFRTLADSHGSRAVCVVLSGTGADGSMGLKQVKERGGRAFVQDPREAHFDEMPRNSIATGVVDAVLPVARIPEHLIAYKDKIRTVTIELAPERRTEEEQQALRELFAMLRARTGHDFTNYKRPTLLRRIGRRIAVRGLRGVSEYVAFMRENAQETHALLKDLLISVTSFFRDRDAFEFLQSDIFPRLLQDRHATGSLRMWVIGCATGEEAYSLAMIAAERRLGDIDAPKVQIFATDIDVAALAHAREGRYSLNDAVDVSPERLQRFFTPDGDRFRVRREIREMVLFANHNIIKDPPFSHVDLITCRNVLIYLDGIAQERVLETAHFALDAGGYLMLGTSESVDRAGELYASVSRENHVFQARTGTARAYPVPGARSPLHERIPAAPLTPRVPSTLGPHVSSGQLHQQLLERYAPPSLVVNHEFDVVHISESAGRYLQVAGGEPSSSLLKLIRDELRLELRAALYQALQRKANVETQALHITTDRGPETIKIHVRPVVSETDAARGFALVVFEPDVGIAADTERIFTSDEPVSRQLEDELIGLRVELRSSTERHEIHTEELKASNEELHALNEELRSAAEELETSREELQSLNEELTTVNQELSVKIDEVSETSSRLQNLINSIDIGTIFLDRSFRVNLFSPTVRRIFNLVSTDLGRVLSDITNRLHDVDLIGEAARVLQNLSPVEREVRTTDGRSFLMRVLPYRTGDDRIQGVVATFTDISERKHIDDALAADLRDTTLLHSLAVRVVPADDMEMLYQEIVTAAVALTRADAGTVQILDEDTKELVLLATQDLPGPLARRFARVEAGSRTSCGRALARNERTFVDFDVPQTDDPEGSLRAHVEAGFHSAQSTPLVSRLGKPIGMVTTHWRNRHRPSERELRFLDLLMRQAADLIEQQRIADALRKSEERFRALVENVHDYAIFMIDAEGVITDWTEGAERVKGYTRDEVIGRPVSMFYAPEELERGQLERELARARETGRSEAQGWRIRKNGKRFLVNEIATAIHGADGTLVGFTKISRDITESVEAQEAYQASEERLRLTLEAVTDYAIFTMDVEGRIDSWPPGAQRAFEFTQEEALGQLSDIVFTAEDRAGGAPQRERQTAREHGRAADERWHVRRDGSRLYMSGVLVPLRRGYTLTGYAKIARDLTTQKQAEERLRLAQETLEAQVEERTRELASANEALRREMFERRRVEDARVFLLRQLVNAQEAERRRISRELHDQLGQEVSALGLKLSMLKNQPDLSAPVRSELEQLERLVKDLDTDLDFLVWELRPTALDDFGLVEALSDYIENWSRHFDVPIALRVTGRPEVRVEAEIETVLYRMTQEALNNVAKHAHASSVEITLDLRADEVTLTIQDDGVGFDDGQPFGSGAKGLGLVGMRERAALAGGSVVVESKPCQGTTVAVSVPARPPTGGSDFRDPGSPRRDSAGAAGG